MKSIIGNHVNFEGTFSAKEGIRIDGAVRGKIESEGCVIIGVESLVEADIVAESVFVAGEVRGNIYATEYVEIAKEGRLFGDIRAGKLIIAKGGLFEGNCRMASTEDWEDDAEHVSLSPVSLLPSADSAAAF